VLCFPAEHHRQAQPGILFPPEFHWGPWHGQKTAVAPWPSNRLGPLLKFTCSWFHITSRFREKGDFAMPMLEKKDKNHSD